jgi:hypothetical protein
MLLQPRKRHGVDGPRRNNFQGLQQTPHLNASIDHWTEVAVVNRAECQGAEAGPGPGYRQQVYEWGGFDVAEGEVLAE